MTTRLTDDDLVLRELKELLNEHGIERTTAIVKGFFFHGGHREIDPELGAAMRRLRRQGADFDQILRATSQL